MGEIETYFLTNLNKGNIQDKQRFLNKLNLEGEKQKKNLKIKATKLAKSTAEMRNYFPIFHQI